MAVCGKKCEVYSRIVGYHRPVDNWNPGKQEEFKDRREFVVETTPPQALKEEATVAA